MQSPLTEGSCGKPAKTLQRGMLGKRATAMLELDQIFLEKNDVFASKHVEEKNVLFN
jgi:hypothetical protein